MKTLHPRSHPAARARRGAALLLSLLILLVLVAIVIQINVSTSTDARVARNDVGLTTMDLSIESALLQEYDKLKTDGEADTGGAASPGAGTTDPTQAGTPAPTAGAGTGAAPGQAQQPNDSRRDEWATAQRTELNDIKLRIIVQDEDSKINVLTMLNPEEKEAKAAFDRVARCLDMCRDGTQVDIDTRTAEDMTKAMLEHMTKRKESKLPRPKLLSDDDKAEEIGLPLSMREFAVLKPFDESHFKDFRDEDGKVVHSITSFLTCSTSLLSAGDKPGKAAAAAPAASTTNKTTGKSGTSATSGTSGNKSSQAKSGTATTPTSGSTKKIDPGGFAVNINTAPPAVLKALFDDREVNPRFWDKVIEYRNLEEKPKDGEKQTDEEPALDEYGNEIIKRQIFESPSELGEVEGFKELEPAMQARINQIATTQSRVFSVFVIARRSTSVEGDMSDMPDQTAEQRRLAEEKGDALIRVVHSLVWRKKVDDKIEIVPLTRWEVIDYVPYEVLDYPDEDR